MHHRLVGQFFFNHHPHYCVRCRPVILTGHERKTQRRQLLPQQEVGRGFKCAEAVVPGACLRPLSPRHPTTVVCSSLSRRLWEGDAAGSASADDRGEGVAGGIASQMASDRPTGEALQGEGSFWKGAALSSGEGGPLFRVPAKPTNLLHRRFLCFQEAQRWCVFARRQGLGCEVASHRGSCC